MNIHNGILLTAALFAASPALAVSQDQRQIALLLQRQTALREQIAQVQLNLLVNSIDQSDRGLVKPRNAKSTITTANQVSAHGAP
jgi:hypothetical protein